MDISSTTISSLTATLATTQVSATQNSQVPSTLDTSATGDQTHLSQMGELMSKLQNLESSNPDQAKQVLSTIATQLADQANANGTTDQGLQALSDKFAQAAQTGDLSGLRPQGGGHHHHHGAPPTSDASSTAATTDTTTAAASAATAAAAASPRAAYLQGSDRMQDIESVISNALNSVST